MFQALSQATDFAPDVLLPLSAEARPAVPLASARFPLQLLWFPSHMHVSPQDDGQKLLVEVTRFLEAGGWEAATNQTGSQLLFHGCQFPFTFLSFMFFTPSRLPALLTSDPSPGTEARHEHELPPQFPNNIRLSPYNKSHILFLPYWLCIPYQIFPAIAMESIRTTY